MEQQHVWASTEALTFRNLVKDCAGEPQLVESFNRAYGADLKAPIAALRDDRWPPSVSPDEELLIGCFIVFVHEQLWVRLQRAQARTSMLEESDLSTP